MRSRGLWGLVVVALLSTSWAIATNGASGATSVRITAAGDYSSTSNTAAVLTTLAGLSPDAHVALGDLSYTTDPETTWCSYVKARVGEGFPFELIAGNHEMNGPHGQINNFSSCLPNQVAGVSGTYGREYFYDLPRTGPVVRVIGISPGLAFPEATWDYAVGDAHYTWLANAIDSARAAGVPFVTVGMHYPCLSVGVYACPLPSTVFDLLLDRRVDLVLQAHEHAYMRSHQLRQGVTGCTSLSISAMDSDCVADGDNAYVSGAGTVFATVGTGGIALRDINPTDPTAGYFRVLSGNNLNPTWGVLRLDVTEAQLSASFVRASGGTLSDSFTIAQDAGPTPTPTPTPTSPTPTPTDTTPTPTPAPTTPTPTTPTPTPTATPSTYLLTGAPWRLNDTGANLGTQWRATAYDDSAWKSGPSQWGYGDGDERTVLTWGSNASAKPITTYGRTTFDAGSIAGVTGIALRAIVDDGAVVYLNGTEVWRFNLPTGTTITSTTRASRYIAGSEESLWRSLTVPASALRAGQNWIAVEVHQDLPTSSDLSFDLELRPVR